MINLLISGSGSLIKLLHGTGSGTLTRVRSRAIAHSENCAYLDQPFKFQNNHNVSFWVQFEMVQPRYRFLTSVRMWFYTNVGRTWRTYEVFLFPARASSFYNIL